MWGFKDASWQKRLGNGGILAGFIGMEIFSLVHRGFAEWARSVDQDVFNAASRYYPTSTLIAVGVGLLLGAIGWLFGFLIDQGDDRT